MKNRQGARPMILTIQFVPDPAVEAIETMAKSYDESVAQHGRGSPEAEYARGQIAGARALLRLVGPDCESQVMDMVHKHYPQV
jgi:hypothetical protein